MHAYSDAISQEILSALRSLTRKTEYVILIFLENLKVIIEIAKSSKNEKVKSLAIQVLKNCAKVSDYERMLAQNNALEMTLNLVPKPTK